MEQALQQDQRAVAAREWAEAHQVALLAPGWAGLLAAGTARLRLGDGERDGPSSQAVARRLYFAALFRATQHQDVEGVVAIVQRPCDGSTDETATRSGRRTVSRTCWAVSGPLFVMVYTKTCLYIRGLMHRAPHVVFFFLLISIVSFAEFSCNSKPPKPPGLYLCFSVSHRAWPSCG
jgi:hypothetical protein